MPDPFVPLPFDDAVLVELHRIIMDEIFFFVKGYNAIVLKMQLAFICLATILGVMNVIILSKAPT